MTIRQALLSVLAPLAPVARALPLIGWFLLTQSVTVAALGCMVAAVWMVFPPIALVGVGLALIVLERKVEIDRSARK